ncbi:MAG TPA: ABC transporter permease [Solirubrobacteraceae bacterium]|nr:ABC transporter permease [Solirubrobacteraceae bacterium]
MRWLLLKDFQILRRSPLLVGLLVLYPVLIALLIGYALSRGPAKPKVAFLNEVPKGQGSFNLGGTQINGRQYAGKFFTAIDPIVVHTRKQALDKVRSGQALAALIIPADIVQKLSTGGLERPTIDVIYNAENPLKRQFVESTIQFQLAKANQALSGEFRKVASQYIGLLLKGGQFNAFGTNVQILGLKAARTILLGARSSLPRGSPQQAALDQVIRFASLAIDNLNLSNQVLASVSAPLQVHTTVIGSGSKQPLDTFAVAVAVTISMMFVCVLLAAGMLALEREENAFTRLARGLVSRLALITEKISLAGLCAAAVGLAMLMGIGAFVAVDWARFPLWVVAALFGAAAFAALGVAIGGLAREVRAASILAFLLSLPIAVLALVPSGATNPTLYDIIRAISAVFPFRPALDAMSAALSGGGLGLPLLHLAILVVAFGALARLSLRRFA